MPGKRRSRKPNTKGAPRGRGSALDIRSTPRGWEFVPPRCAEERQEDLEEVQQMIDAEELDVATDELRWLLNGCPDCLTIHRLLGEIALSQHDVPLARGHFGYAFEVGRKVLRAAGDPAPVPYALEGNQDFLEAGKGLAWCLTLLNKQPLALPVIELLLTLDPSDPLKVAALR